MNKKYLVDVTDLSPNPFDPKSLFDKNKVNFKDLPNFPFFPFSPPLQKKSFPWGLLLLTCLILPLLSPDLRRTIDFDYSNTSNKKHTPNNLQK